MIVLLLLFDVTIVFIFIVAHTRHYSICYLYLILLYLLSNNYRGECILPHHRHKNPTGTPSKESTPLSTTAPTAPPTKSPSKSPTKSPTANPSNCCTYGGT
mmetsp:Transcript_24233/g.27044  ORF Transcript_24233/g.27044 Transcript_24233/m.27044 type:complete len:101 (+) Transcript_24233:2187-2489(+)